MVLYDKNCDKSREIASFDYSFYSKNNCGNEQCHKIIVLLSTVTQNNLATEYSATK